MRTNGKALRPFEGQALEAVLKELALINAIASSLQMSLEPLSTEDKAAGAEPLTAEQIKEDLEKVLQLVTGIVLQHIRAEPEEWYAANDKIE
jgi:hypothetical protein